MVVKTMQNPTLVIGGTVAVLIGLTLALVVRSATPLLQGFGTSWSDLWLQVLQSLRAPTTGRSSSGKALCARCQHRNLAGACFSERVGGLETFSRR